MSQFKEERNEEMIDEAIRLLTELKDSNELKEHAELRITKAEGIIRQDVKIHISIDIDNLT